MVTKLGENISSMTVYGFIEETVIFDNLRVVGFDHAFPRPVIGVYGQFAQDDQSATAFSTPGIIGHMTCRESPLVAEVCSVGEETDTIREGGFA
jgi:hypothetical protein